MVPVLQWFGRLVAGFLSKPSDPGPQSLASSYQRVAETLRPCDVLLVEGNTRISTAIKYLSQSTWSHAALYVGDALSESRPEEVGKELIEADLVEGVRAVGLESYSRLHMRIVRPVRLSDPDRHRIITYAIERLGHHYDLRNVVDLARYLLPTPPVPTRWRRQMIALGSGDPTRAICSTLIAQAFQSVHYPILPEAGVDQSNDSAGPDSPRELLYVRHHSLFTPRDFDVSPYFEIIKPTLAAGFDYRALQWGVERSPSAARAPARIE